jgi:hypothetical protein
LVALYFDTHRVEKNEAGDARWAEHGHLGGDPAADGVADDSHVFEPEVVEQASVEGGEPGDAVEVVGPGGPDEAGVGGREYPVAVLVG